MTQGLSALLEAADQSSPCALCVCLSTPPAVKKDMFTFNTSKGFVGIKKLYFCVSKIIGLARYKKQGSVTHQST